MLLVHFSLSRFRRFAKLQRPAAARGRRRGFRVRA